ncbi:MBL fold metallo-hydrolase [Aquimarina sp. Aq78]|nr:MBL fold metallo-hydrolase [Aquimarina sp. Aq78]
MALFVIMSSCKGQTKEEFSTKTDNKKVEETAKKEDRHSKGDGLGFNPTEVQVTKLSDNIYQYFQFMYNSLIIITDEGVIVTDPASKERAAMMRNEIKRLTDKPVTKVIYSHDHYDHTRGGAIFKDEGAKFISQEKAVELISRDPYGEAIIPDITYKDNMTINLDNGSTLDLLYYGPNDGDAMTIFHFPKEKILFAVDFHLPRYVNEPYRLIAHNYGGILQTMKRIKRELDFDIVVSGHTPTSSPELFDEDLQFVEALYSATLKGLKEGRTTEELMKEIKLPEFSHWRGYEENLPGHIQRMSYTIWHGN